MSEINIIIPSVASTKIEQYLCELTKILVENNLAEEPGYGLGGHWGYGTDFENNAFLIHSFCWCEQNDCPWCIGCDCSEDAYKYFIDNNEVNYKEWDKFYIENMGDLYNDSNEKWDEYKKRADEINKRRTSTHEPDCDYCLTGGISAEKGGGNGKSAPNFWHKSSGLKIWWYKWIGRSMEYNKEITEKEWKIIFDDCVKSIYK